MLLLAFFVPLIVLVVAIVVVEACEPDHGTYLDVLGELIEGER